MCHVQIERQNRFIPELVKKVTSGVSARRRIPRHWRSDEESERDSVCLEGYAETGTSSKVFCSRNVSGSRWWSRAGCRKSFASVGTDLTDASAHNMCPCAVKRAQLVDFTRCASYDMSAMTNSAANVHILDFCVI